MSKQNKNYILITAGIMLAFSFFAHYTLFGNHILHGIVNIFAGGRSNIKLYGFFVYTILLCALAIIPAPKIKVKNKWLLTSVLAAFGYGLLILIYFLKKLGFGLFNFIITFNNSELSTTIITHNHVMKGVLGLLSGSIGNAVQEKVDTGWAFVGLIPAPLLIIAGILAIAASVLLILKYIELVKQQQKWHVLFIILYAIVSFSLIKNIIDGGIFNKETPIAMVALLFIIIPWKGKVKSVLSQLSPFIIYLMLLLIIWVVKLNDTTNLARSLFQSLIFAVIFMAPLYIFLLKKVNRKGVLLTILALVMLYVPLALSVSSYLSLTKPISNQSAYLGVYNDIEDSQTKFIEQIENLKFYEFTPTAPYSASQLLLKNNLLDNIGPITIPWNNCLPASGDEYVKFELASKEQLNTELKTSHRFGNIVKFEPQGQINNLFRYKVILVADPCAPRSLNLMEALLKERGAKTFFVLDINQLDEENR